MARKPYRVEAKRQNDKTNYYLVKDVNFKGQKAKVSKSIGREDPSARELERLRLEHGPHLEMEAVKRRASYSARSFRSDHLSKGDLLVLEELRHLHSAFQGLLTVSETELYERSFELDYIQGTTAIEGNTLTPKEVRSLMDGGILPRDKSLREVNEVQNFCRAKDLRDKHRGRVTLNLIRSLHRIIMDNIDESAGTFRRIDAGISGFDGMLTPPEMIEEELSEALERYYASLREGIHPFEAAVLFHHEFEVIHPFTDGNGRVGREVFNHMLIKERFPRLLFLGKDRDGYLGALQEGNEGRPGDMVRAFVELMLEQRLEILEEQLRRVSSSPKRDGQISLDDFLSKHH